MELLAADPGYNVTDRHARPAVPTDVVNVYAPMHAVPASIYAARGRTGDLSGATTATVDLRIPAAACNPPRSGRGFYRDTIPRNWQYYHKFNKTSNSH